MPDNDEHELGDLVDLICRNTTQMLDTLPTTPRNLRVQAGEVSVEVGWAERGVAPAADGELPPAGLPTEQDPELQYLTAPVVGSFYPAPEPGAKPFTGVDETVEIGQQVGIVEAMKLLIPVEADKAGRIVEVFKGNGEPVEYDEPLFSLNTSIVDDS